MLECVQPTPSIIKVEKCSTSQTTNITQNPYSIVNHLNTPDCPAISVMFQSLTVSNKFFFLSCLLACLLGSARNQINNLCYNSFNHLIDLTTKTILHPVRAKKKQFTCCCCCRYRNYRSKNAI